MSAPDRLARAELLRRYGTAEALPEARLLHAGPLSARFEDGALRALRWQGVELVRGISYLLRDDNWGTVPAQLTGLRLQQDNDRFELHFDLCMPHAGQALMARARILGTVAHQGATMQSHLVFEVEATASGPLRTNRCGFVVLHPAGCAGLPLSVTHTTGVVEDTNFPAVISPGQPVFDIRSLRHSPAPGVVVDCTLQAELPHDPSGKFEMEDQRNWSDASFKTYVASLRDPWPYELPAGIALRQRIEVQVQAEAATADLAPAPADTAVLPTATLALRPGGAPGLPLPALGVGVPRPAQHMAPQERHAVVALRPGWLVVEAELDDGPDDPAPLREHLRAAAGLALEAGASVQLDLIVADACRPEAAAARTARLCREAGLQPQAVRAQARAYLKSYQPDDAWPELPPLSAYAAALRLAFPEARVGGGFVTYFTELNRKRPQQQGLDFIGHATCPIVHAADDASVMETLETLPHMARSVHALWPQQGYRLGPSTLAALRNPYGSHPTPNPQGLRLAMAERDPRHQAAFGAAWTAAYAASAVPGGLELLALHHSHGPSGPRLLPTHPDAQAAGADACVPAWGVLAVLALASGRPGLALAPGLPPALRALAWQHDAGTAAVLIAHTGDTPCRLACPAGTRWLGLHAPRSTGADLRPPHTLADAALTLQPCDTLLLHLPI